ncbi:MAG TPA: FtsX-like permease family protein [Sediminibacterium sp.]|nr:FtsX-like permease family protein [Sediminibacterium sp.]
MFILKLAWKNLWRNRIRSAITMAAIFFAVLLSVLTSSLKNGIFDNLINNLVSLYSGYIQIHKKGYWDDQLLDNALQTSASTEKKALSNTNVANISARLESFALASTGEITKGCRVIGINPPEENKITLLSSKLVQGKYLGKNDNGILVAEGFLKRVKLHINDTLILLGQGYHGSTAAGKYPIKGVIHFGLADLNDNLIYMPLLLAQDMYGAQNMATGYALSLRRVNELELTAKSIRSALGDEFEVMTWKDMMPDIKQHISTDTQSMLVVQAILYLLISFGIFGTLLMMMAERKYELGMLVAIGMKKSRLAWLLLLESVMTVLLGCIAGIASSIPVVYYFNRYPIRITGDMAKAYEQFGFEAIFPTSLSPSNFISQGFIVLLIGLTLSLYPVYTVWKLNPVEAMKK